jgi:hypothetical protein
MLSTKLFVGEPHLPNRRFEDACIIIIMIIIIIIIIIGRWEGPPAQS